MRQARPRGSAPNLLLVVVDQLRASVLAPYAPTGTAPDPVATPRLDALAAESVVLTQAVSGYPVCSPARAMLLTGLYPHRDGVAFNVSSATAPEVGLPAATRCWSDVLAEAGYHLGYVGKWHLTAPVGDDETFGEGRRDDGRVWDAWTPPEQRHGFGFWYAHGSCDDHRRPHYWTTDAPRERPLHVERWSPEHEVDVACGFLADAAGRPGTGPFGLVVSINPPHQPFDHVPAHLLEAYAATAPDVLLTRPNVDPTSPAGQEAQQVAAEYFAAVAGVDEQVGRLLDALETYGLGEDTVVVVTSDHGMQLGSHDLMYKNVCYEESVRVPLLVRWPGRLDPRTDEAAVASVDLAPTLLGLLGLPGGLGPQAQGRDLSGRLLGTDPGPAPDASLYFHPAREADEPDVRGLRTRTHKLVRSRHPAGAETVQLFDLAADPFELLDRAGAEPGLVERLSERLDAELAAIGDPWPDPVPGSRRREQR